MTASAPLLYLGLMSGTSMDSLDAALVDFSGTRPVLLGTEKKIIDAAVRQKLLRLCASFDQLGNTPEQNLLEELDQYLAIQFSEVATLLLEKKSLTPKHIAAIGSHGQTVFHCPPHQGTNGFSRQIGNPQQISHITGITTVGDFRNADMRAGGQGAPLVPAFHQAVFHSAEKNRVIVNIGGMANITILPASGIIRGFDTGPGNVLMDGWIQQHAHQAYDAGGAWAAQETPDHELLHALLAEKFFQQAPPKSTGRELFNLAWLEKHITHLHRTITPATVQATLATLTATTITDAIKQYAPTTQEIFVCGGGAHNTHLMTLLQQHSQLAVMNTAILGIEADWVEAAAFAWLAKQRLEGHTANLPEVTGAQQAVVLGEIFRN